MNEQRCAVLIVEDDEKLQDLLRTILTRHATSIDVASDGERAIELLQAGTYDIVILDLMLPKINGLIVADALASPAPDRPLRALPLPPRPLPRRHARPAEAIRDRQTGGYRPRHSRGAANSR